MPQIGKQQKVTNLSPCQSLMKRTEHRSTSIGFMQIRQCSLRRKNKPNCSHPCQFIGNATQNRIDPQKVPFGNNVCRSRIRICRNIVIRVSLSFWMKGNLKSLSRSQHHCCSQIFRIKIWIKVNQICCCSNPQRICRSILMQCSKMNQAQCCLQKWKQIMKAIKTIQCRIIYSKASPEPSHNTCTNNRQCTCQTCNHCSAPQTHLQIFQCFSASKRNGGAILFFMKKKQNTFEIRGGNPKKDLDCTLSAITGTHR